MEERRRHHRQRSLLSGRVRYPDLQRTLDCVVRDLSPEGARLRFVLHAPLPDRITLDVHEHGALRPARVVWQNARDVGVAFLDVTAV